MPKRLKLMAAIGFDIKQFTPYHFRIEGKLHYWTSGAYHDLRNGLRGKSNPDPLELAELLKVKPTGEFKFWRVLNVIIFG